MPKIKLKEWADRNGLTYITAYRHFHAGMIPGATQLDSGTILVENESPEQTMAATASTNDAMSVFLKKTVEFSKNDSTVEDFAAYIISNFQLKLNAIAEVPRYSKNKPNPEEIQKHFKRFLPDKEKEEHLKAVKDSIKEQHLKAVKDSIKEQGLKTEASASTPQEVQSLSIEELNSFARVVDTVSNDTNEFDETLMSKLFSVEAPTILGVQSYDSDFTTDGLVTRSVDLNTTPQQINYTGSTNQTISSNFVPSSTSVRVGTNSSPFSPDPTTMFYTNSMTSPFQPTQKELLSSVKVIETVESDDLPRKRGRKPIFKKR
jgi:hypothetical protein